jgi:hypothetical protein
MVGKLDVDQVAGREAIGELVDVLELGRSGNTELRDVTPGPFITCGLLAVWGSVPASIIDCCREAPPHAIASAAVAINGTTMRTAHLALRVSKT